MLIFDGNIQNSSWYEFLDCSNNLALIKEAVEHMMLCFTYWEKVGNMRMNSHTRKTTYTHLHKRIDIEISKENKQTNTCTHSGRYTDTEYLA